jgi:hypothetical protein
MVGTGGVGVISQPFIPFRDPSGDEIDIYWNSLNFDALSSVAPVAPSFFPGADLYSCLTDTCITDFIPPDRRSGFGASPPVYATFVGGPAEFTVTPIATPEPSALGLLAFGLFVLGVVAASRKIPRRRCWSDAALHECHAR